ncbi:hypothetical protein V8C86DRAFT_2568137 [Haematococcus lacustris]
MLLRYRTSSRCGALRPQLHPSHCLPVSIVERAARIRVQARKAPVVVTSEEEEDETGTEEDQAVPAVEQPAEGSEASQLAASAAATLVEPELVTEEVTEEVLVIDPPLTFQSVASSSAAFVRETNVGKGLVLAAAALAAGSLGLAVWRYVHKYQSTRNQRLRQVNRNKLLVEEISKAIPGNRALLTPKFVEGVRARTGFTMVELFRKYLWFLLRERKFDQSAVDDLVALKQAAGLSDEQVAEALQERSQRVYDKYGTLMLNTDGMSSGGVERKAACTALFRKLLYLTEHDPLLQQGSPAATSVDLKRVFGALEEDVVRLRITSLYDIDLERAFGQDSAVDDADDEIDDSSKPRS